MTDLPGDLLRPPEPVALHLAPLLRGRRAGPGGHDRLARPLARPAGRRHRTTTRSRASASAASSRPALATARVAVAAATSPSGYDFPSPGVYDDYVENAMAVRLRPARQPRHDRPDPPPGAPGAAQRLAAARPARDAARHLVGHLPGEQRPRATTCAASCCCSRPACRSAPARSRATAASTRTPTRPRASATTCSPTAIALKAYQDAPRGRGPRRPRDHVRLERVRPPARGERLARHRPRRRGRRLPDRLQGDRADDRRVPDARLDGLDQNGNVRATTDFRGVYCSVIEDWLNTDAAMVIPGADPLARYPVVQTT